MCILLIFRLSLKQKDAPFGEIKKSTKHVLLILEITILKANSSLRVTPWETSYQQKNEMKEKFVTT